MISYLFSIVTMFLSCTVSEILSLISQKLRRHVTVIPPTPGTICNINAKPSLWRTSIQNWKSLASAVTDIHCVSKNDTDVAHYNFNAHQPIWVIFLRRYCWKNMLLN